MATSSITHNFVISNPESAERFIHALEQSAANYKPLPPVPEHLLTDPDEIKALTIKWAEKNGHKISFR